MLPLFFSTQDDIPEKVRVDGIEVALLTAKVVNYQYKLEDYAILENFNSKSSGPYTAKEAKTVYIAMRVKVEKPSNGDYEVKVNNKTTYIEPKSFSRGTGKEASYLVFRKVTLSKGHNILEITVKSPDGTQTGTYTVIVKYDGGPDPVKLPMKDRRMIRGVYCPAQRRPLAGEKPDFVWLIGIAGWCSSCPTSLNVAGSNGGKLASKFRSKGLRVIAIDIDNTQKNEAQKKWIDAGADFYLYDRDVNCFEPFYKDRTYYPYNITIKEWERTIIDKDVGPNESNIRSAFGF